MEISAVKIQIKEDRNFILGQAHFIKTVEDLYEALVNSVPNARFGIAFAEASGPCLIRKDGNDVYLIDEAVRNIKQIGAGHTFMIVLEGAFPINVMPAIKACREVVNIFCATANPVEVVVAKTDMGCGILGVIDGYSPKGIETDTDVTARKKFLEDIGYKR